MHSPDEILSLGHCPDFIRTNLRLFLSFCPVQKAQIWLFTSRIPTYYRGSYSIPNHHSHINLLYSPLTLIPYITTQSPKLPHPSLNILSLLLPSTYIIIPNLPHPHLLIFPNTNPPHLISSISLPFYFFISPLPSTTKTALQVTSR